MPENKKYRYPRSKGIYSAGESYVQLDAGTEEDRKIAFQKFNNAVGSYSGRVRGSNRMGFEPGNVGGTGISGRYGMTHKDYEAWRPDEQTRFRKSKDMILYADTCYRHHGLIRNVIDIMSDFASQGIRVVHPNKRIEKFYQNWFMKVNGFERSERFLNNLYRLGNVVVRVQTAKLNKKDKERLQKTSATPDMDIERLNVNKGEIPWKFTFLHPATIEVQGGVLSSFVGKPKYAIALPPKLRRIIKAPKTSAEKELVAKLPKEIIAAAETSEPILLNPDKTRVFHYKKDDWQTWADPMIAALALDISLYEKLKLADRAALDGAISNIRIFKIGSLEYKLAPTEEAAELLSDILESNTEAGTLDLIWGPDIELIESQTSVHQFLGQEKYEPTLMALYAGLGIPPTLTGTFGAGGTTNNFISLKTMTKRLEYGRDILTNFWNEQLAIVQEAMGFRFPATIEFDLMNLGDEAAEKALLIQLSDRSLISDELLQRHFGNDPDMERIRTNRERKEREKESRVRKAGPFHEPYPEEGLKKVALQSGVVTPSQVGLELEEKKSGEKTALEMRPTPQGNTGGKPPAKKGQPSQGRPKNSKDSTQRKTKTFKPKVKASAHEIELWAVHTQDQIEEILNPVILAHYGKKSMRELTSEEFEAAEDVKFGVLSNIDPMTEVNAKIIAGAFHQSQEDVEKWFQGLINEFNAVMKSINLKKVSKSDKKYIKAKIYASQFIGEDNG